MTIDAALECVARCVSDLVTGGSDRDFGYLLQRVRTHPSYLETVAFRPCPGREISATGRALVESMRKPVTVGETGLACAEGRVLVVPDMHASLSTYDVVVDEILGRRASVLIAMDRLGQIPGRADEATTVDFVLSVFTSAEDAFGSAIRGSDLVELEVGIAEAVERDRLLADVVESAPPPAPLKRLGSSETWIQEGSEIAREAAEHLAAEMPGLGLAMAVLRQCRADGDREVWDRVAMLVDADALTDQFWRAHRDASTDLGLVNRERDLYERVLRSCLNSDCPIVPRFETTGAPACLPSDGAHGFYEYLVPFPVERRPQAASRYPRGFVVAFGYTIEKGPLRSTAERRVGSLVAFHEHLGAYLRWLYGRNFAPTERHLRDDLARSFVQALVYHPRLRYEHGGRDRRGWVEAVTQAVENLSGGEPVRPALLDGLVMSFEGYLKGEAPTYVAVWRLGTLYPLANRAPGASAIHFEGSVEPALAAALKKARIVQRFRDLVRRFEKQGKTVQRFVWRRAQRAVTGVAGSTADDHHYRLQLPDDLPDLGIRVAYGLTGVQLLIWAQDGDWNDSVDGPLDLNADDRFEDIGFQSSSDVRGFVLVCLSRDPWTLARTDPSSLVRTDPCGIRGSSPDSAVGWLATPQACEAASWFLSM